MKTSQQFARYSYIVILFLGILPGCGPDPAPVFKYSYTVINESELALKLSCPSCEIVILAIGETRTFGTNTAFADYLIEAAAPAVPPEPSKTIEYKETSANAFTITAYYWEVMYRVSGSAGSLDVSFINGEGGTSNFTDVKPGTNYQIKEFSGKLAQISATVTSPPPGTSFAGHVLLYIFHKDKRIQEGGGTTVTSAEISLTIE